MFTTTLINWIHNIVMVVAVVMMMMMMMMTTPTTTMMLMMMMMMMMMMKPVLHVLVYHIYSICICYCQIIYLIAFEFIELPLKKYSRHPWNHWLLKRWTSSMASHVAQVFKNYFALSQAHSPRSGFLKIHVGKLLNNSKVPQRHGVWKSRHRWYFSRWVQLGRQPAIFLHKKLKPWQGENEWEWGRGAWLCWILFLFSLRHF